jgi:hypothetical protein
MRHLALLALCALVLTGCGASSSVQQTTDDGQAALRTRAIPLYENTSSSMTLRSAQAPIQLSALSRCLDANCTEGGAYLVLRSTRGVNSGTIDYTPVILLVDGQRFEWPELDRTVVDQRQATGEFLRLAMDITKLRSVAFATDVKLNLGSSEFDISYSERGPMRELIAQLQGGIPGETAP